MRKSKKAPARRRGNFSKEQPRDSKGRFLPSKASFFTRGKAKVTTRSKKPGKKPSAKARHDSRITARVIDGRRKPDDVCAMYDDVLKNNFSKNERKAILENGVEIVVEKFPDETVGEMVALEDGSYRIFVAPKAMDEETLTHESIHILQNKKVERTKEEKKTLIYLEGLNNLNEAKVEAETICRVREFGKEEGYYGNLNVKGKNAAKLKEEDKATISSSKYEYCQEKVNDKFDETHISGLKTNPNGLRAKITRKKLKFLRR